MVVQQQLEQLVQQLVQQLQLALVSQLELAFELSFVLALVALVAQQLVFQLERLIGASQPQQQQPQPLEFDQLELLAQQALPRQPLVQLCQAVVFGVVGL